MNKPTYETISVREYKELNTAYKTVQGIRRAIRDGRISDLIGVITVKTIGNQYALVVDKSKVNPKP